MGSESIPNSWRVVKLGDIGEVARGRSRHRPRYAEHLYGGPYPFIQTGDVKSSNGRINSHEQTYSDAGLAQSRLWPTETMCITIAANIAETGVLEYPACFPDSVIGFIADKKQCDVYFVEYMFRHLKRRLQHEASGSVQDNINLQTLERLNFYLPPLNEQKLIARMLGSLDNKIQLNRQINQTLEQMAQALFKSWFVDFDPVIDNALAAGNPIPEALQARADRRAELARSGNTPQLPDPIRKLFPNNFIHHPEMGWIPEGWEVTDMTKMVKSISDTYPLKEVDKVIFLNTGDIEAGRYLHHNYSEVAGLPGQAKKSIQYGDILYSEIRPKNRRYAYVNFDGSDHVVSTKLMVLRAKESYDPLFIYFILTQEKNIYDLQHIAEVRSGTFPQITYKELSQVKATLPKDRKVVKAFSDIFLKQHFEKSFKLEKNSEVLKKLRDTLLPKLISGELRLPDTHQPEPLSESEGQQQPLAACGG